MASGRSRRGFRGPLSTALGREQDADWLKRRALGIFRQSVIALMIFGLAAYVGATAPPYAPLIERLTRYTSATDYGYDEVVSWVTGLRRATVPHSWEQIRETIRGWWDGRPEPPEEEPDAWSLLSPAEGPITSGFGWRVHPIHNDLRYHTGVDIGGSEGANVLAARPGVVKTVAEDELWGKNILIEHSEEQATFYAHLAEIIVAEGMTVERGQVIGTVGNTGATDGFHLHFELREKGQPVDPEPLIRAAGGGT